CGTEALRICLPWRDPCCRSTMLGQHTARTCSRMAAASRRLGLATGATTAVPCRQRIFSSCLPA
ncbi:unnamed protein product, partial [Symbiodinium sp. CCMP2592]